MKKIKLFKEHENYLIRRDKQKKESENQQMVNNQWLEDHPYDGIEKISLTSHTLTVYFKGGGYIILYNLKEDFNSERKNEENSVDSYLSSEQWVKIINDKDKFLSWMDKLLIHCNMDRTPIKRLSVIIRRKIWLR